MVNNVGVKETPILFSQAMLTAIHEKRKTNTRRTTGLEKINRYPNSYELVEMVNTLGYPASEGHLWAGFRNKENTGSPSPLYFKCPYGKAGDLLWIKEPHYQYGHWQRTGEVTKTGLPKYEFIAERKEVRYLDDPPAIENILAAKIGPYAYNWSSGWYKRTALFMPKIAARSWLEIVLIKVERVRNISSIDCRKEGIKVEWRNEYAPLSPDVPAACLPYEMKHVETFLSLWDSINKKRGYGSDVNPWDWAIEFREKS